MAVTDPPRTRPPGAPRPAPRRRVSRRRYMVRRAGALAVVALVAIALYAGARALLGGDGADPGLVASPSSVPDGPADPDGSASGAPDAFEPALDTLAEVTTDDAEAAAAPAAASDDDEGTGDDEASADEPPSQSNPAEVYIVGDSDAGTFGPYLERLLDGTLIVDTELNYKVSSGLARPDFFDWPAELASTLPDVDPDIVVVTFGGNDSQGLAIQSGEFIVGDPVQNADEWSEEYERRAGEVMDLLLQEQRTVIWVGIPNDDNADVTARLAIQDGAVKAAAAARPDVVFVDTWTRFSGRDGGWAEFVIDPRDGQGKDVRAGDGFHLNEVGAEILALDIAQAIRDDLRLRGANV